VDTLQPTVLNAYATPDPTGAGLVTITIEFSEEMLIEPLVEITGLAQGMTFVTGAYLDGDTWEGTFTLVDNQEEVYATIDISEATDIADNMMEDDATWTFAADTIYPVTQSVESTKTIINTGDTITFMGTVADGFEIARARLYIYHNGGEIAVDAEVFPADGGWDNPIEDVYIDKEIGLPDGVYQWTIIAEDAAGNVKAFEPGVDIADNFRVDNSYVDPGMGDAGFYAINIPGTPYGFTTSQPSFLMSIKQLEATTLADYNVDTFLTSSQGPESEKLTTEDVDMVWAYDGTQWASYDVDAGTGDFTSFDWTSGPGYYELALEATGEGKSIRHD